MSRAARVLIPSQLFHKRHRSWKTQSESREDIQRAQPSSRSPQHPESKRFAESQIPIVRKHSRQSCKAPYKTENSGIFSEIRVPPSSRAPATRTCRRNRKAEPPESMCQTFAREPIPP